MQCENCGKSEAAIQLTTVKNNEMRVLHLCESCAAEQGVEPAPAAGTLPLADFLAQMGTGAGEGAAVGRCPHCGLTPAQLKQTGRLGCAECYSHFNHHLRGLLRRLHGGTQHVGKVGVVADATDVDRRSRLESLRRSLQRAIDSEDFEHAAALRDQIRHIDAPQ